MLGGEEGGLARSDRLCDTAAVESNDRQPRSLGFEINQAIGLADARPDEDVVAGEFGLRRFAFELAVPNDAAFRQMSEGGLDLGPAGAIADDAECPVFIPTSIEDTGERQVARELGAGAHHAARPNRARGSP